MKKQSIAGTVLHQKLKPSASLYKQRGEASKKEEYIYHVEDKFSKKCDVLYQLLAVDGAAISVILDSILVALITSWLSEIFFIWNIGIHLRWTLLQDLSTKCP